MHPNMSYELEGGTRLLATNCIFCGRSLRDPASLERACGPHCAAKHGVFVSAAPPDAAATEAALETAPEPMARSVREKLGDPREALSAALHAAGRAWETQASDTGHYIGSAMEIAQALGFHGTHDILKRIFIEGWKYDEEGNRIGGRAKPRGIVVTDLGGGRWRLELPYMDNKARWFNAMDALKAAGARNQKTASGWELSFPEIGWIKILNAMVQPLSGTLGVLPDGETFIVPEQPLPVPAPDTPPAGPPDVVDTPPPAPQEIPVGTVVQLNDGREMVVGWTRPDRIGVMSLEQAEVSLGYGRLSPGRAGYEFLGTESVQTVKASVEDQIKAREAAADRAAEHAPIEREYPAEMFAYQRESAVWLDTVGSGVLALDMGLGKTLVSLACADTPVVVVCPASLRSNWVREVNRWRPDWTAVSIGTGPAKKGAAKAATLRDAMQANVVVINYDILKGERMEALKQRGINTLIVDEAHFIKELRAKPPRPPKTGSQRAIAVWHLAQIAKRRFMLTGTPMINGRPYELWPLLNAVAPRDWPDFYAYCQQYCRPRKITQRGRKFTDYNGKANLEDLRERTAGKYMLRKTKEEELDLPPKQRRTIEINLDEAYSKEYARAAAEFIAWVRAKGGHEAAMRAARAEAIARMTALRRLSALGKVEAFTEQCYLHLKSTGRPLVVMGHHKEPIASIGAALTELGYKVGFYTGDQSPAEKDRVKDHFQDGIPAGAPADERDYLDVIMCSITSAGFGLTLTRAREMFFLERAWRPGDLVQAEDRIYRIGTKNDVTITYYDGAGTLDMMLRSMLVDKQSTVAGVIDGRDFNDEASAVSAIMGTMFGEGMKPNRARNVADENGYEWAEPDTDVC